jgi:predicted AlkP superfamily pyrophosphatase or phosphodiesterase
MRPDFATLENAPTLNQLARDGVVFQKNHAVYCSSTEVNGTALATGAYPEHSGIIANRDYLPSIDTKDSVDTQDLDVIHQWDEAHQGQYLLLPTLAETLHRAGKTTAISGSKPVVLLQDRNGHSSGDSSNLVIYGGRSLPPDAVKSIRERLGPFPPAPKNRESLPNALRDEWTTRTLLACLWSNGIPDFSLLWLSEPDLSQHAVGPGAPEALAAVRSSDRCLALVLAELDRRGEREHTDVLVVSDHGFSTRLSPVDVAGQLQSAGFNAARRFKSNPKSGDIMVVGQGGSVLFYVIDHEANTVARLVDYLQRQSWAGVVLTRQPSEGAFTLAQAKIDSPRAPDVVVSMRWSGEKARSGAPGLLVADSRGSGNSGLHASMSPFDMHNTLVAAGPDFKRGFVDTLPTGNVDVAPTVFWLLGVDPGALRDGRILNEALVSPEAPTPEAGTERLSAARTIDGRVRRQYLQVSQVGSTVYLDEGNVEAGESGN